MLSVGWRSVLTGFAGPVDRKLITNKIVRNVNADVTGD